MGVRRPAGPAETREGKEGGPALSYTDLSHHAEPPPGSVQYSSKASPTGRGAASRSIAAVRDYLPRGGILDDETFAQRHRLLCWILGLHIPALFVFGLSRGIAVDHVLLGLTVPLVYLVLARVARPRRVAAFFVAAGLVFCSSLLVYFSGGAIEAHFHFFVLIGFIALYQDWVPLLWNVVFVVLSHGYGSSMAPDAMYSHAAGQNNPWLWAGIHGVAVLAASAGIVVYWRHTELVQQRNIALTHQLAAAEVASAQTEVGRRQSISSLLVHLARRNQSLLDRQLALIGDLEQRERTPETLAELFKLDHLATRMRRNAESLLVLSGEESPRRWGRPVALVEVVRAAAAEVEDYERVDVLVSDHLYVEGRVVADLAHLVAELIENATIFSPPDTEVRVQSYPSPGQQPGHVLSIEDMGIGMSESDIWKANQLLAETPEVDLRWMTLGFHVVSRLSKRHDLSVRVAATPGGGVTALVMLGPGLVTERTPTMAPAAGNAARATGETPVIGPAVAAPRPALSPQVRWPREAGAGAGVGAPGVPSVFAGPAGMDDTGLEQQPQLPPAALPLPSGSPPALPPTGFRPLPGQLEHPPVESEQSSSGGLSRRVPGERLAAPLRLPPPLPEAAPAAGSAVDAAGDEGPWSAWGGQARAHDSREHVRSMLSRFQASQRAARAVAEGPVTGSPASWEESAAGGSGPDGGQERPRGQDGWLSRFEASQEAGRAVAGNPLDGSGEAETAGSPGRHSRGMGEQMGHVRYEGEDGQQDG